MRAHFALPSVVLLLVAGVHAHAAPPDPAKAKAAMQRLEAARSKLAEAVKRIEKDPPANPDLDAAAQAVDALKEAVDAAAEYEAVELDYAKAVLTARKELRTQREYVDQRRANIQLHDYRRQLDGALATMNERVGKLSAKQPGDKEFDDARAAVSAVKKLADQARPLAPRDPKFATFLGEVDAALSKQQGVIDDRWLQLSADKQRALLDDSRRALGAAMTELGKAWSDAHFDAADKAAAALAKRIEEGAPLEAKDKAYRAEAEKGRTEIANAKKRMAELVKEAGLARVKAEFEPAYGELTRAAKALKARKPTPEQLAEAKTAAIVVGKLVEKFEPQAARSPDLAQYVNEVKATLTEVEVVLQRRALDAARAEVNQAMKQLQRREPTDEQFQEAASALLVLEKTLETVNKKDPELGAHVFDAKQQIKDAKATIEQRRWQVDLVRHRAKLNEARKAATAAVQGLQQGTPSAEQFTQAEAALKQVTTVLEEGKPFLKKDGDYVAYAKDTAARVTDLTDRIARRKIVLAAAEGRKLLLELLATAKAKLETSNAPQGTDADLQAATKSVEAIATAIDARVNLENQDMGYAASSERARNELQKLYAALDTANQARELRRETGEVLASGTEAVNQAASSKDIRKQKELFRTAIAKFKACQSSGQQMLRSNPALSKTVVLLDGSPSTAPDVVAACGTRAQEAERSFQQADGLVRFEDGPKKAYESAKYLLANSRKDEAIKRLDDCIADGRIVQSRWPEFKERKFQVAGGSYGLEELIQQCVKDKKALAGK